MTDRLALAERIAVDARGLDARSGRLRVSCLARDHSDDPDLRIAGWLLGLAPSTVHPLGRRIADLVAAVDAGPPQIHRVPGAVTLALCARLAQVRDGGRPDPAHAAFRATLFAEPSPTDAALWDVLDAMAGWPCPSDDPRDHPAWREFRRRVAHEPTPGQGSRVALDELDRIGAWAGRWVAEHAPPHVRALALAELRAACPDGGRTHWDKEATALRTIEALATPG